MKQVHRLLLFAAIAFIGSLIVAPQPGSTHCQIPCGIYDDHARVLLMLEDTATIDKAVKLIGELSGKTDPQSQNQLVRWIMNKEQHAENIIATISNYFLTQRVKPDQPDYAERLAKHHTVMIEAMKAKQSSDPNQVAELKKSIEALTGYYPEHNH